MENTIKLLDKIKNFFIEIGKSILVFASYLILSLILGSLFGNYMESKNFWVANFSALAIELVILAIFIFIYRKKLAKDFKNFKKDYKKIMDTSFKNWLLGLVIMLVSNIAISMIVGDIANNEELNRSLLMSTPIYAIIAMVIIAPITEELIFRLSPRKAFTKKIPYLIYSAIFFGAMHLLASTSWIEILYIIPYGALGYFFAKSFYETDNIFSSISVHMIHNTIAVLIAYLSMLG